MMIHNFSWQFMTIYDKSWQFQIVHDNLLQFMTIHDIRLQFMMFCNNWGQFMRIHEDSLQFMTTHDKSWQCMIIHDIACWFRRIYDNSLGFMTIHDDSLRFALVHLGLLEFTWVHIGSLEFTLVWYGRLWRCWRSEGPKSWKWFGGFPMHSQHQNTSLKLLKSSRQWCFKKQVLKGCSLPGSGFSSMVYTNTHNNRTLQHRDGIQKKSKLMLHVFRSSFTSLSSHAYLLCIFQPVRQPANWKPTITSRILFSSLSFFAQVLPAPVSSTLFTSLPTASACTWDTWY